MHKSSKIKLCLLSLPLMLVAVAAAGCGEDDHTHTFSNEWAFNTEGHWRPSSCSHDVKANKSEHEFIATVIPPSGTSAGYTLYTCACGYSYASDSVTLPVESGKLCYDESEHWEPALSAEQINRKEHVYEESIVEPTCSTYGYTKHACACGYWYATDTVDPVAHSYDDNVWGHDEFNHWHPALCCGANVGITAHDYTEKATPGCSGNGYIEFICGDCGYFYQVGTTDGGHAFANTFESDEFKHWRPATCGHATEKADEAEHTLIGNNNVCEVCKKVVTPRLSYELSANGEYYIVTGLGCVGENTIEIPDQYLGKPVQEIADRAFKQTEITNVALGANVKKIGAEAFTGVKISAVNLTGVEEIGTKAFANTNITALALGASIQKISNAAFRACVNLETVTIESSLNVLPPYAFEDCSSLKSVTCATKPAEVGAQAFSNCTSLTAIDLSACTKVGFAAFGGCEKFAPASLQSLAVAEQYAFSGCAIETVTLSAMLTQISDNLFDGCTKLTTVELWAKSVGESAFGGCGLLSTVTLHGAELIGESAFEGCSNLTSLALPDTVVRVGENAFKNTGLITEQDGVKYAANVAVGVNSGVNSVTVKAGTVGIADGAFRGTSLNSVTLGEAVRFIGVSAFRECGSLTAITFTASVQYIGANAFRESGLTSVTVPSTVESVGDNAFYDCKSLTTVSVSANKIGRFAFSYTGVNRTLNSPVKERPAYAKLANLTIGSNVTEIGSNAFQYCPITSVTLPENLTVIGKYAFAQTDLVGITIPASVTRIGEYAFYDCASLTSVTFADATNWKAGNTPLNLAAASQNATYLKSTYLDIDWIKGVTEDEA